MFTISLPPLFIPLMIYIYHYDALTIFLTMMHLSPLDNNNDTTVIHSNCTSTHNPHILSMLKMATFTVMMMLFVDYWIWCILWLRLWQSLWYEWSNCTPTFLKYFQALVQHHDDVTKKNTQALSQQQPCLKQEHYEVPQYDNNLQFIIVCSYALQQWQENRLCQELFYVYTTIDNYLKENKIHDHDVWIFIS